MRSRESVLRAATSVLAAGVAFSLAWIGWAVATQGDYFANGSSWLKPSLLAAALTGGLVGWFVRHPAVLPLVTFLAALSLSYWLFVPDGWWATEPPL